MAAILTDEAQLESLVRTMRSLARGEKNPRHRRAVPFVMPAPASTSVRCRARPRTPLATKPIETIAKVVEAQTRIAVENEPTLANESPADLAPAWRAAVYRLMGGDASAQTKVDELRVEEFQRMGRWTN